MIDLSIHIGSIRGNNREAVHLGSKPMEDKESLFRWEDFKPYISKDKSGLANYFESTEKCVGHMTLHFGNGGGWNTNIEICADTFIPTITELELLKKIEESFDIEIDIDVETEEGIKYTKNNINKVEGKAKTMNLSIFKRYQGKTVEILNIQHTNVKGSFYKRIIAWADTESPAWKVMQSR